MKVNKPRKHAYHAPDGHTLVNTPSGPVLVCNETGKATPLHDATLARRQAAIEKAAETNARKRREKYMKAVTAWREEGVCPISKKPTGVGGVAKSATGATRARDDARAGARARGTRQRAKPTCVCGGCREGGKLWCRMGRKAPQLTLLQLCKKVEGSRIYSGEEARAIGLGAQPYARQKARPWLGVMSPAIHVPCFRRGSYVRGRYVSPPRRYYTGRDLIELLSPLPARSGVKTKRAKRP